MGGEQKQSDCLRFIICKMHLEGRLDALHALASAEVAEHGALHNAINQRGSNPASMIRVISLISRDKTSNNQFMTQEA